MSYTSSKVKTAWKQRNYKCYAVNFRYDTDKEIIDYIEQNKEQFGTTEIFRAAMQMYRCHSHSDYSMDSRCMLAHISLYAPLNSPVDL